MEHGLAKAADALVKRLAAEKKKTFKDNKALIVCYICKADAGDFERNVVRRWRFCEYCGLWCCKDCLPDAFNDESVQPKTMVCNNCAQN